MRVFPCLFPSDLMVKLFLGKGTRMAELCLLINHSDVNLSIVCVYAPTQPAQPNCFLRSLHRFFFTRACLIVCGDFNCYENMRDKFGGNPVLTSEFANLKSNLS